MRHDHGPLLAAPCPLALLPRTVLGPHLPGPQAQVAPPLRCCILHVCSLSASSALSFLCFLATVRVGGLYCSQDVFDVVRSFLHSCQHTARVPSFTRQLVSFVTHSPFPHSLHD